MTIRLGGNTIATVKQRVELTDLFALPYFLTFIWQYLSAIPNKPFGWMLATVGALIVWTAFVGFREPREKRLPWQFWFFVGLPLLVFYSLRVFSPDVSFDVLNYHIFHTERALRGSLWIQGDFFPTPAPFNPAPDILTGLYRHLLGYRLGTTANLCALIWTGTILHRLLRPYISGPRLLSIAVLAILCTEQVLFQINNYMVDLLAMPLLLEALRTSVTANAAVKTKAHLVRTGLLLGGAVAFKLSNLAFALPIAAVALFEYLWRWKGSQFADRGRTLVLLSTSAVAFLVPLFPFSLYVHRQTGNPFFPLYNAFFKSPYWPESNIFDPRWGPNGITETLVWPVLVFFKPERFGEFPVYSGRISIGLIVAVVCLLAPHKDLMIRRLSLITLAGAILWSAASGYSRYAIFIELTSGVLIVWLIARMWSARSGRLKNGATVSMTALWLLLFGQAALALIYANRYEWSSRPTVYQLSLRRVAQDPKELLRDYSLASYLLPEDREAIDAVDVWVETNYKTTAVFALLKPNIPVIGVRMPQYFSTVESRERFAAGVRAASGKRMFTLTEPHNLAAAQQMLARRRLVAGTPRVFAVPFFSQNVKLDFLLVEVRPNPAVTTPAKSIPLLQDAFNAKLEASNSPSTLRAGEKFTIQVTLTNQSDLPWPGRQPTWQYQVTIGNRWLTDEGEKVNDVDGRASLVEDLAPGQSVTLPLTVTAPERPGYYLLEIDAIQEGVAWFGDHGSQVFTLKIRVQ